MRIEFRRYFLSVLSVFHCKDGGCFVRRARLNSESPKTLAEPLLRLTVNHGARIVISLHAPNPVIQSVLEIAHTAVRVTHRPASD